MSCPSFRGSPRQHASRTGHACAHPSAASNILGATRRDEMARLWRDHGKRVGSRNKLSEAFIRDVQEDWEQSGKEVLRIMREKFPEIYFQCSKGYRAAGRCLRRGRGTA